MSNVEYNSAGSQGLDEYAKLTSIPTLRIAFLGASQAEGNMVDCQYLSTTISSELLNAQLEHILI